MYKKALKTIIVTLILSICALSFVACSEQAYTVTIYDGDTVLKTYDSLPQIDDLEDISKPGYIYEGAYYDKEFTDEFKPETFGKLNSNLNLYLKYEKRSFIVQVNSNGGSEVSPVTVYYDTPYEIPAPTKQGYTFAGYTLDGEEFAQTGTYTKTNGVRLFANWVINSYEVKFLNASDNNAQLGDALTKEYNSKISSIPTVNAGYEIENDKVYSDSACTQEVDLSTYKVTQNADLYVKVVPKTYTIKINKNGGDDIQNVTVLYNGAYELVSNPTRTGYTFNGYTLNGEEFALTGTYNFTSDITIDATWEAIEGFYDRKVIFKDGETELSNYERDVVVGETVRANSLPILTKTGYEFNGWYVDANFATAFNDTVVSGDITLYAKFTPNSYVITLITNGADGQPSTLEFNVVYGTKPENIPTLTKNGYKFSKFVESGTTTTFDVNANFNVANNVVIEALWEKLIVEEGENSNLDKYNLFSEKADANKDEVYFKEKLEYNQEGEYTYVFIKGIPYTFSNMTVATTSNLITIQNNGFTASTIGSFKLTITKIVEGTPVTYVRNAKVVENVAGFIVNETRNPANFNSNTLVEAMSVGTANGYKPDITIKNINDVEIGFSDGNVIITATNVANNSVIYIDTLDYNSATGFNLSDLTVGETYEFSFVPKYYAGGNTATIKVTINNGVNVYTNAELRNAYGDLNVHEINVLRNITAELSSEQYVNGDKNTPYYTIYNTKTGAYYNAVFNDDGSINKENTKHSWVYFRSTINSGDSLTLHGNSFTVDGSKLPHVNAGESNNWVTFGGQTPATNRVVNHHLFIFHYMTHKPNNVAFDNNTFLNNNNSFNIENLAIFSNNTLQSDVLTQYSAQNSYYTMSATYNTLAMNGGNFKATNVAVRNSLIGFFISGGYDETYGYGAKTVLDDCFIDNSWANSICTFFLNHLTLKNTNIKSSGGGSIHFDCHPYPNKTIQDSTLVLENSTITNWIIGTEAWLNAYNMAPMVGGVKEQLEAGLNQNNATCIKETSKGDAFNFAIIYQQVGDPALWAATTNGKPVVNVNYTNNSNSWTTILTEEQIQGALGAPSSNLPHWYAFATQMLGIEVGIILPIRPTFVHPGLGQDVFNWAI